MGELAGATGTAPRLASPLDSQQQAPLTTMPSQHHTPYRPCFIIAQAWPSWLQVYQSLHLTCLRFYTHAPQVAWPELFPSLSSTLIYSLEHLRGTSFHPPSATIILMQRGLDLLWQFPPSWFSQYQLLFGLTPVNASMDLALPFMLPIAHSEVGGVTDGVWWVGSNCPVLWSRPTVPMRRARHIFDSSAPSGGFPKLPPPLSTAPHHDRCIHLPRPYSNIYSWEGLNLAAEAQALFCLPSSHRARHSHWCARPLSPVERGRTFDIGPTLIRGLTSLPTASFPPGKLLFHFGLQALHTLGGGSASSLA